MKLKVLFGIGIVGLAAVFASSIFAAVLTGTSDRVAAAGVGWSAGYDDQSVYPTQNDRSGQLVYFYLFSEDGGGLSSALNLQRHAQRPYVPTNLVFVDGFVQTLTPLTGTGTPSYSLGCEGTADLVAAGTAFNAAGFDDLVCDGSAANFIYIDTPTNKVKLYNSAASIITDGMFMVFIDVTQGQ